MEKQTIIRGAAIIVAGIAASTFGAQHLMSGKSDRPAVAQSALADSDKTVVGAGFIGSPAAPEPDAAATLVVDDTSFVALSDAPSLVEQQSAAPELRTDMLQGDHAEHAALQDACTPDLVVRTGIDALIELSLTAPCHVNERLVVSHADLAFSAYVPDSGAYSAFIPALERQGKIDIFLGEDVFLTAEAEVTDIEEHLRVVLQWTGDADFGLHAYHRDATFGENGHLHALRPFDPMLDEAFLVSLGERHGPEPMLAEVYSIPAELDVISRIELELRFDSTQCAQEMQAYILQSGAGIPTKIKEARLATPDCPSENGIVVMGLPEPRLHQAQLTPMIGRPLSELVD